MSPKNAELTKLFDEAIAHWERMIAWAERQPKDEEAWFSNMLTDLKEIWFAEYCGLCREFLYGDNPCLGCSLYSEDGCCDGLWSEVNVANTWEEWVERASGVLTYIKEKRDESISHKSR